ncbi:Tad domain-containing protein [Thermomonospora echinospora]|uniref:Tad domain-containing protein n=1 Tax=Thermomonospora echinospora TaxID=1992 RepID=UPI002E0DF6A4
MFAVLMSSLVVVGMLALVVDVGLLYVEREELQNGADAGVLAAARACAQDEACTPAAFVNAAQTSAEQNARDGAAWAILRCARINGAAAGPCPLDDTQLTRCVGPRPAGGNFVEIRTRTRTADGGTLFPPVFGAAVLGSSYQGGQAAACARAAWGPLGGHSHAFAFGIAECAFEDLTSSPPPAGSGFVPADRIKTVTPDPAQQAQVRQRDCANPADPAPATGPGALAWLGPPGGDCLQDLRADTDVAGIEIPSDWTPPSCQAEGGTVTLETFLADNRRPLPVPVYDSVTPGGGGSHRYHITGFAYFLPTGYWFGPGSAQPSWSDGEDCDGSGATSAGPCLMGFFTKGTVVGAVGTGPDRYGLRAIQLIG